MVQILFPVILSMLVGACLTLALVHFFVWLKVGREPGTLLFSLGASIALVGMAYYELSMMLATTPEQYGTALRWLHLPVWLLVVALVGFVLSHLRAGRRWLGWTVCGLRTASLLPNFTTGVNINYLEITHLRSVPFLGDSVSMAEGIANPWMFLSQLSLVLLLLFISDAMITMWRRGDRHLALMFGAGFVSLVLVATVQAALTIFGLISWPVVFSVLFSPLVAAMSYEVSLSLAQSEGLVRQLHAREDELSRTEQRLQLATEGAGVGVWEWNVESDEMWLSEQGLSLIGSAPGEQINLARFLSAVHPDDRETLREAIERSRKEGGRHEREYRIILPGGRVRWIATRSQAEISPSGKVMRMRGIGLDITERKLAENRFQRVVESAPYGMLILDAKGGITFANRQIEACFGFSPQELAGRSVEILIPERIRAAHAGNVDQYIGDDSGPKPMNRDVFGLRKDGTDVPLQVDLCKIPGPDGNLVLVTVIDVSERRQLEGQQLRERAFLRQIIDINPCLIFVKDLEGRFALANQAVATLYGTTPRELIGKTDADFNRNVDEVEFFRRMDCEVLSTRQERFIAEEQITDTEGRRHWLQTIKRPIEDRNGKTSQLLGVSTDITARKERELQIERQRNELAHLSRVTMLSELSGSLAHELNQPLTAILSNAQAALRFLAQDNPDIGEVSEILRDIVDDDRRAGGVIQSLRLLLKKGEMLQVPLDLNEAVRVVLKLVRSDLLNAEVSISTVLAPDLPRISGDQVQLQQVVLNLVVNACEAMSGEAAVDRQIIVTTKVSVDGQVQTCVADQGRGIVPEELERVFDPFFTTKAEGLGLGLAVCRRIVEAHDGRMWATSNAGRGACFCFSVPAYSGDAI
ncbi:MAG: PAS domain S-box protein [Azoarcus sp.]|nr:PAS domain S-box protein [Azoarcus sp.]